MLFEIDKKLGGYPSSWLNAATGGPPGSSLCARAYEECSTGRGGDWQYVLLMRVVDWIEPGHCERAHRIWVVRLKKAERTKEKKT